LKSGEFVLGNTRKHPAGEHSLEESHWLKREANNLDRHHGEVFDPWGVRDAKAVREGGPGKRRR
jgi:hypothetical protein